MKTQKHFSPIYLVKSAYNAAAQEAARSLVCAKYGIKEISRREALRVGFKTGRELNEEVQFVVASGGAVPTREAFTLIFKNLCIRHSVAFDGGIEEFLDGAWKMADNMGMSGEWRNN